MWLTCQTKNGHFLDPQGNGRWEVARHLHEEFLIVSNIAALCVWVVCVCGCVCVWVCVCVGVCVCVCVGGVCGWCVCVVCVSGVCGSVVLVQIFG